MEEHKGLALFSGGLDSLLAIRLLREQERPVEAVHLMLPFTRSATREGRDKIKETAAQLDVKLHMLSPGPDLAEMIARPKFGHGKNFNPCQDCRIYQLRKAAELMPSVGASYLVTGEVVGQRPMSQRREALFITDREAGMRGLVLRPLSAHRLPSTIPEERGWVDRSRLLGLSGRGRTPQEALAREWGLSYPAPGGGCLLTYKEYADRYRSLLDLFGAIDLADIPLVGLGRHFRLAQTQVIIGRNQAENKALAQHFHQRHDGRGLMQVRGVPGPLTLILGEPCQEQLDQAASLTARYADHASDEPVLVKLLHCSERGVSRIKIAAIPAQEGVLAGWRVNN